MLIPKIQCLRESSSYIERQIMLEIIEVLIEKYAENFIKSEPENVE
jgi:hypothetical protein